MPRFKPDFNTARERWAAFWNGTNTRPLISAVVPGQGMTPVPLPPYGSGWQGDFAPVIDQIIAYGETHEFLGEAVPFFNVEFAANHFSALLGADLVFPEGSAGGGWVEPYIRDWNGVDIRFDCGNKWWRRTEEFIRALRARCDGAMMVCAPSLVANLDALAAMRGTEALMLDLVEQPGVVHRLLDQTTLAQNQLIEAFKGLLDFRGLGSINRHGMYSAGFTHVLQCDASCMISREMFAEFGLPYILREAKPLDHVDYHLDGPGAIQHLEAICAAGEIDVIQWVPGAGAPEKEDWTWLYKKILSLGKRVLVDEKVDSKKLLALQRELKSNRIYFRNYIAGSKEEAEETIRESECIAADAANA